MEVGAGQGRMVLMIGEFQKPAGTDSGLIKGHGTQHTAGRRRSKVAVGNVLCFSWTGKEDGAKGNSSKLNKNLFHLTRVEGREEGRREDRWLLRPWPLLK